MAALPPVTTGLQLLLDPLYAKDSGGNTITADSTTIVTVPDQSGQGNTVTIPSGGSGPTFKTNIFGNSRPAIRMGASVNVGLTWTFGAWGTGTGTTVIMAVANFVASASNYPGLLSLCPYLGTDYDGAHGSLLVSCTGSGTSSVTDIIQVGFSAGVVNLPLTQVNLPTVQSMSWNSTTAKVGLNGQNAFSKSASIPLANNYVGALGQRITSGTPTSGEGGWPFDLGLMAIYNRMLSDAEHTSVSQWMMKQIGMNVGNIFVVDD